MPYKSDAQRRWAHTLKGTKALGGKSKVQEWDKASKGLKLPEHVKMHEGGKIPKDGVYELQKGEVVIPKEVANMKSSTKKKHNFRSTRLEHHADGSITIHHEHESDPKKDVRQAVASLAKAHKAMDMHLNQESAEPAAEEAQETPAEEMTEQKLPLGFPFKR